MWVLHKSADVFSGFLEGPATSRVHSLHFERVEEAFDIGILITGPTRWLVDERDKP
jgi:hypothetical protein